MIRTAKVADARAVAEVQVAGWHAAYRGLISDAMLDAMTVETREPLWASQFGEPEKHPRTTVFQRDRRVIGFGCFGPSRTSPALGEVWALYVAPHAWRTGAGRALMEEGLSYLEARGYSSTMVWVLDGNARAIRFYEACGFRLDGSRTDDEPLSQVGLRR